MSNCISNHQLKTFVRDSIDPLIARFNKESDLESCCDILINLDNEIKSAAAIFSNATQDIRILENLQKDLCKKLDRHSVQVLESGTNAHPERMKDFAPVGLHREGANCSFNAILQLIANAPSIARQVLARRNSVCQDLAPLLQGYYDAQLQTKAVAEKVDSQTLRKWVGNVARLSFIQVDAFEALQALFEKIGFHYTLNQEFHKGTVVKLSKTTRSEPMIQLDLSTGIRSFQKLLANFFSTVLEDGQILKLKFEKAPEELIIQAKRFKQEGRNQNIRLSKVTDNIEMLEHFILPAEYTQWNETNIQYELRGCMIHTGKDNSGHYISLERKLDGWYLIDDTKVKKITSQEANSYLQQGYIYHYRKVQEVASASSSGWTWMALTFSASIVRALTLPLFNFAMHSINTLLSKQATGTSS